MSISKKVCMLSVFIVFLAGCTTSQSVSEVKKNDYYKAWDIDYSRPEKYVQQGPFTQIDRQYCTELDMIGEISTTDDLHKIYRYVLDEYAHPSEAGYEEDPLQRVEQIKANKILELKILSGELSYATLMASVLRYKGVPALVAYGVAIGGVLNTNPGSDYTFVETYIDGRWVLLDPTNRDKAARIAESYDPENPVIDFDELSLVSRRGEQIGYYIVAKGLDLAESGYATEESLERIKKAHEEYIWEYFSSETSENTFESSENVEKPNQQGSNGTELKSVSLSAEDVQKKIQNRWGVDYNRPAHYLKQGSQTRIPQEYQEEIDSILGPVENIGQLLHVYDYIHNNYRTEAAGGRYIGTMTVETILREKFLTGCHDHGLFVAAILRHNGVPAVLVDGVDLNFVEKYPNHDGFGGHVYVEAFIDSRWILLDSTNSRYVPDYDYTDPVINEFENENDSDKLGKYVMFKGLDSNSYGVNSHEDLIMYLIAYAKYLNDEYQVEKYFESYSRPESRHIEDYD